MSFEIYIGISHRGNFLKNRFLQVFCGSKIKQWHINPPMAGLSKTVLPSPLCLDISRYRYRTGMAECTRDNEAATQFRDVWTPHCFPHRFHRGSAITTRTLNGRPRSAPVGGRAHAKTDFLS